jgi:hypothetical protein
MPAFFPMSRVDIWGMKHKHCLPLIFALAELEPSSCPTPMEPELRPG